MAKDELLNEAQRKRDLERRLLGRQWMIEAEVQYQKSIEQAKNGANRGQKMTREEKMYNREILKTVSQTKKDG